MVQLPEESKLKFEFPKKLQTICIAMIAAGLVAWGIEFAFPTELGHHGHGEEHAQELESGADEHGAGPGSAENAGAIAAQAAPAVHSGEGRITTIAETEGDDHAEGDSDHEGTKGAKKRMRFFYALHLGLLFALPLALGGVFFAALQHISGAAWSVTIRRVAETYWFYLPVVFILMAVIFFTGGMDTIFKLWVHAPADDPLMPSKTWWLDYSSFIARNLIFVALWILFGYLFWKYSTAQDEDGKLSRTRTMAKFGGGFLVLFGLTYSANSWDLSMSMYPHWFSTMWAIYTFAGLALTLYASLILWIWFLKRSGYYGDAVNENHLHDLGKFLFGHTIFWAYIGFSQYMLIWYAHIPEVTGWFKYRTTGGWYAVTILLAVVRFGIPFFALVKRDVKRNWNYMAVMSVIIIIGQVWDIYWYTYPVMAHGDFVMFGIPELGSVLFVLGSFVLVVGKMLERAPLIPKKDPRLEECLHFHQ